MRLTQPIEDVRTEQCKDCTFAQDTAIFELCKHEASLYHIGPKSHFHTRTHMIKNVIGACPNYKRK